MNFLCIEYGQLRSTFIVEYSWFRQCGSLVAHDRENIVKVQAKCNCYVSVLFVRNITQKLPWMVWLNFCGIIV